MTEHHKRVLWATATVMVAAGQGVPRNAPYQGAYPTIAPNKKEEFVGKI